MGEFLLRVFFPGVVIRRLEAELREQREAELVRRFDELSKQVDEMRQAYIPQVIIQNPYPQITPITYGTSVTWSVTNDSGDPPAAMSLVI